jgi:hypothetical protein
MNILINCARNIVSEAEIETYFVGVLNIVFTVHLVYINKQRTN